MKTTETALAENQAIEDIIVAFQGYAMDDIRFNETRPIAAAILISCLLDQIASYLFDKGHSKHRATDFIKKYLPEYEGVDIYGILRNAVVHHYSIGGGYSVTSDILAPVGQIAVMSNGIISIPSLIKDIGKAVDRAVIDLRNDRGLMHFSIKKNGRHGILALKKMTMLVTEMPS